ncbi:50S ribosomal protein L29 [Vineibacter terrae]|uniref:Large ribosomal subunit protein uL29 n=1 Tax=Vineibacter terrae TaxID=2586908 RepID=A0A5C8PL57_9HYPH|nr:50S ribosomal protein L29 [Vineibacter terrae]TXL74692.1 50S ribosomal protein L29 [Vineibacter terrae]HEX2888167.1 50S ribosomal protein L29 [Vineibacter terrae]
MSKAADLQAKTVDELKTQLIDLRKESFNLRFQKASGQLDNTARMRRVKRDIARIRTVLVQKTDNTARARRARLQAAKKAAG